jgi:hypothetical protein
MKEIYGNLWEQKDIDALCITTNGFVKNNGRAVMGRGCAKEAMIKFAPNLDLHFGQLIREFGNIPVILLSRDKKNGGSLVSFPVKHNWWEVADLELIKISAIALVRMATLLGWSKIVIPRPGCGNGKLDWKDVKPILEKILDDRFFIISREGE